MTARDDDLGATDSVFNRHDIRAQAVAHIVVFHHDAFALRHDRFKFAQIENHIGSIEASHRAADDFTGAVLELFVNHLLFHLANALHHRLFGRLCGDAAEILRSDFHLHGVAHLRVRFDPARFGQRNFVLRIFHVVDHEQTCEGADFAGLWIDIDAQIARRTHAFLRS